MTSKSRFENHQIGSNKVTSKYEIFEDTGRALTKKLEGTWAETIKVFLALKSAGFLNQPNIQKKKKWDSGSIWLKRFPNSRCLNYFQSFHRTLCSVESFEWHLWLSRKTLFSCAKVLLLLLVQGCRKVWKSEGADYANPITTLPSEFSDLPLALRRKRSSKNFRRWEQGFRDESVPLDWYRVSSKFGGGGGQKPLRFRRPCSSSPLVLKWGYLLINNNKKLEKVLTDCCQQILGFKRLFLLELCKKENNESMVREFGALHKYLMIKLLGAFF